MYAYTPRMKVLNFLLFVGFIPLLLLTPFHNIVINRIMFFLLQDCNSVGCREPAIAITILCTVLFAVIGVSITKTIGRVAYAAL